MGRKYDVIYHMLLTFQMIDSFFKSSLQHTHTNRHIAITHTWKLHVSRRNNYAKIDARGPSDLCCLRLAALSGRFDLNAAY